MMKTMTALRHVRLLPSESGVLPHRCRPLRLPLRLMHLPLMGGHVLVVDEEPSIHAGSGMLWVSWRSAHVRAADPTISFAKAHAQALSEQVARVVEAAGDGRSRRKRNKKS